MSLMGMNDSTGMHINRQQADMDTLSLIKYQKIHADNTISNLEAKLAQLEQALAFKNSRLAFATA